MATNNKASDKRWITSGFFVKGTAFGFIFLFYRAHQPNNVNGILLLLFFASLSCLPRHVQFQNRSTPEIDRFLMEIGTEPKSNMLNKWQRRKKKNKNKNKKKRIKHKTKYFSDEFRLFFVFLAESARHEIKTCVTTQQLMAIRG